MLVVAHVAGVPVEEVLALAPMLGSSAWLVLGAVRTWARRRRAP